MLNIIFNRLGKGFTICHPLLIVSIICYSKFLPTSISKYSLQRGFVMRILHITSSFYPCIGGVENYVMNLCLHLIKRGHASNVLTLKKIPRLKENLPDYEEIDGIEIHRVLHRGPNRIKLFGNLFKYIADYDVLHIHNTTYFSNYFILSKFYHGIPIVASTLGGFFHTKSYRIIKKIYFKTIARFVLGRADMIIAISKHDLQLFSNICRADKLCLVFPGINLSRFAQIEKHVEPNLFLYYGRISTNKRIDNLIRTFSYLKEEIPEVQLSIIGSDWDGLQSDLQHLVEECGLVDNVSFQGELSDDEILQWLSKAAFFVSATQYEGFGISILEAMSSGTIAIVNNISPINGFIEDGKNGFLINYNKPREATQKIVEILEIDETDKNRIIKRAANKAKQFSWEKSAETIEHIYEDVTKKTRQ